MTTTFTRRLGRACKRFGPGRLPGADGRVLGAGYALASTALLVAALFVVPSFLLAVLDIAVGFSTAYLAFGVVAVPLVTVSGFCSGLLVWRFLPDESPLYGGIGGLVATGLTYVVSTILLLVVVLLVAYGDWYFSVAGAVATTLLIAAFGTLLTVWVALPVGAAGGYLYESVRADHTAP